ncbi:Mediator of RNA polymerase II transcription subunit 7 [Sphaceloma murrayae]|uniref:Mediator of RNA polymerase II transcription subunit 7 n=1 Tax=Sphaceloma murrayae TaxID=2082308 RepID=A0A2K1QJB2_9PEZI|nr:Mediator of RNA polymerase II transcription subunit 7 [Sphaceloma murrayae]
MAEQGQAPAMNAPFPNPPPYFKHFTKENLARLRDIRKTQATTERDSDQPIDPTTLPDDLRYLLPPAPPSDGKYKSFGVQHDLSQPDISLSSAGITQIYPVSPGSTDPTPKLIALSRAILLNFLELVGIIANDPEQAAEKIEDLQTLFYNAHDLINQYRPHQARESLILMMEEQVEMVRAEMKAVKDGREKVGDLLRGLREVGMQQEQELGGEGAVNGGSEEVGQQTAKRRAAQRGLWDDLDREMG